MPVEKRNETEPDGVARRRAVRCLLNAQGCSAQLRVLTLVVISVSTSFRQNTLVRNRLRSCSIHSDLPLSKIFKSILGMPFTLLSTSVLMCLSNSFDSEKIWLKNGSISTCLKTLLTLLTSLCRCGGGIRSKRPRHGPMILQYLHQSPTSIERIHLGFGQAHRTQREALLADQTSKLVEKITGKPGPNFNNQSQRPSKDV